VGGGGREGGKVAPSPVDGIIYKKKVLRSSSSYSPFTILAVGFLGSYGGKGSGDSLEQS